MQDIAESLFSAENIKNRVLGDISPISFSENIRNLLHMLKYTGFKSFLFHTGHRPNDLRMPRIKPDPVSGNKSHRTGRSAHVNIQNKTINK